MQRQRVGAIAEKVGMTSLFAEGGNRVAVTLLRVQGCQVVSHIQKAGGEVTLQMGFGQAKRASKALRGYFEKAGVSPKKKLLEFPVSAEGLLPVGAFLSVDHFVVGQYVDVTGVTIGKGFAGGMKRHNFAGLRASHGVSVSHRSHGSTGNRKSPGKVFKGKKMAGHLGCEKVTVQNLQVMAADAELGVIAVKGAVPGYASGLVVVRDAIKKPLTAQQPFPGGMMEMPVESAPDSQSHSFSSVQSDTTQGDAS